MSLAARYSGTCPECGGRWQPGDLIRSDAKAENGMPIWQHEACPDNDDLSLKRGETVCQSCFLVHPEGQCEA